jgi:hypothetical protein
MLIYRQVYLTQIKHKEILEVEEEI